MLLGGNNSTGSSSKSHRGDGEGASDTNRGGTSVRLANKASPVVLWLAAVPEVKIGDKREGGTDSGNRRIPTESESSIKSAGSLFVWPSPIT